MQNGIILQNVTREELLADFRGIVTEILNTKLQPTVAPGYLTKGETAARLRLSLPTLQRLTASGTLKGYRIGRRVLFRTDEVEEALKSIGTLKYKRG
jgi:excisionase family DNA binding protein